MTKSGGFVLVGRNLEVAQRVVHHRDAGRMGEVPVLPEIWPSRADPDLLQAIRVYARPGSSSGGSLSYVDELRTAMSRCAKPEALQRFRSLTDAEAEAERFEGPPSTLEHEAAKLLHANIDRHRRDPVTGEMVVCGLRPWRTGGVA